MLYCRSPASGVCAGFFILLISVKNKDFSNLEKCIQIDVRKALHYCNRMSELQLPIRLSMQINK